MISIENGRPVNKRSDRIYTFIISAVLVAVLALALSLFMNNTLNDATALVNDAGRIRGGMQRILLLKGLGQDITEYRDSIDALFSSLLHSLSSHPLIFSSGCYEKAQHLKEQWDISIGELEEGQSSSIHISHLSDVLYMASDDLVTAISDRSEKIRELQTYAIFLWILTFLAVSVLIFILKKVFIDKLLASSMIDTLTGIKNRNYIHEYIEDFCAHTRDRKEKPFRAFILADIDHFKRINDTYGHQRGDDVLVSVARTLETLSRRESLLFRYGGEEFLLLLRFSTVKEALLYTETVRRSVQSSEHAGVTITMSFGVGACTDELDFHRVIGFADSALYAAKEAGRNRTFYKTSTTDTLPAEEVLSHYR